MFAVPGWSVGAAKPKAEKEPSADAGTGDGGPSGGKNKKKRKRPDSNAVTAENVADYWEKVIEGKGKQGPKRPKLSEQGGEAGGAKPTKNKKQEDGRPKEQNDDESESRSLKAKGHKKQKTASKSDEAPPVAQTSKKDRKKTKIPKNSPEKEETPSSEPIPLQRSLLPAAPEPQEKLTPLQAKMRAKLISARFRHLNETLYTHPSADALAIFSESPDMFSEYHSGFRRQVSTWPENPVDSYISLLLERAPLRAPRHPHRANAQGIYPSVSSQHLPFTNGRTLLVDLGCGDAKIASTIEGMKDRKLRIDIQSFDLASSSPLVTKADISNLPLADGLADIAVFCLALMGTNWLEFIEEAWRVLRRGGELWVAEIKSRFGPIGIKKSPANRVVEHSVGRRRNPPAAVGKKALRAKEEADAANADARLAVEVDGVEEVKGETDVSAFMEALARRGFLPMRASDAVQMDNKMFVKMFFVKVGEPTRGKYAGLGDPGREGIQGKKKPKFTEDDEEDWALKENKILKPCVYKVR